MFRSPSVGLVRRVQGESRLAEIAKRHRWAVELLAPRRGESVLEIGCGHGIATELVLAAGADVVAVDRSGKMVEACIKRNEGLGRLTAFESDFETLDLGTFDAAFAVNVDFPRHEDRGWAKAFHKTLKLGGRAVLDYLAKAVASHRSGSTAPAILPEKSVTSKQSVAAHTAESLNIA